MTLNSTSTSVALSAEVGSSMMRMRELTDRARAISTICCCPRRSSDSSVPGAISSCSPVITTRTAASSAAKSTPPSGVVSSRPMKMLSRTLRFEHRLSSWWMIEIPKSRACTDDANSTTSPFRRISPLVGDSTPERIFISVDFPAPFSPNRVVTLPRTMSKLTPLRACTPP